MNNAPKVLIPILTLLALLGVSLVYSGIGRLRAKNTPPFAHGLYTVVSMIQRPPDTLLLRLDSTLFRWIAWMLVIAVPVAAGVLCFGKDRPVAGMALLLFWGLLAGFLGFWIWLYSAFHALSA